MYMINNQIVIYKLVIDIYKERFSYYELKNGLYIEKHIYKTLQKVLKKICRGLTCEIGNLHLFKQFIYLLLLNMRAHKRNTLKQSDILDINKKFIEKLGIEQ